MPLTKSAIKAEKVAERKRKINLIVKKNLKEAIKKVNNSNIGKVYSIIDKAVKKNIIHKNKAARIKSQLVKKVSKSSTAKNTKVTKTTKKNTNKKIVKKSNSSKKVIKKSTKIKK